MLPRPTGLSFQPGAMADPQDQRAAASALGPSQRALQVISLHLPKILGARAIAPSGLLQPGGAPTGGLSPESAVLQSALKAMQGGPAGPLSGPSMPGLLPPSSAPRPTTPREAFAAPGAPPAPDLAALVRSIVSAIAGDRSSDIGPTAPSITIGGVNDLPRVWEDPIPAPPPPVPPAAEPEVALPRTAPETAGPIRRARAR